MAFYEEHACERLLVTSVCVDLALRGSVESVVLGAIPEVCGR